jgi:hypothetical protein
MSFARWSFIPLIAILTACASVKEEETAPDDEKPKAPKGPELVGRVASIAPDRRFVLIQSIDAWKQQAGAILTTRGTEDRTANLLVTGEALGQFAAADIQSGNVEIGDAVYSHHTPKPSESKPESSETPEPTEPAIKGETEIFQGL